MAQTTNIGLYKLGAQSKLKDFPNLFNDDLDIIDSTLGYGFGQGGNPTVKAYIDALNSKLLKVVNVSRYSGDGVGAGQCSDKTIDCSAEIEAGWLPVGVVSCVASGGKFIASLSSIPTSRSSINVRLVNVDTGVVYPGDYTVGMLIAKE